MRIRWLLALGISLGPTAASAQAIYRLDQGKLPAAPLTGDLKYYGGRVISNVKIVEVSWGSGVDSNYLTQLQGFYQAIVTSPFVDWLSEYDTLGLSGFADLQPGSSQHIGRGSFVGSFVITPQNQSTSLSDADIQTELAAELASKALPAPEVDSGGNVDSLYMVDFPAGVSITLVGLQSCSGFGAYHGTFVYQAQSVPYGVHPNCNYSFDTSTLIHSHELAEAMTDTEVGLVETNKTNPSARPLAWVTLASTAWDSLEIADICQGTSAQVAGYTVQKVWSNYAQACVAEIPICDGVLVPPACRPCSDFDSGNACADACALSGPKAGQCVTCTSKHPDACTGATPACDDATYTCVACTKNADCNTAAAPTCDLGTHTCRACQSDSDCGGGGDAGADGGASGVCDTQVDSTQGQCVACNDDAQCKTGEQCTAHACVPLPQVADAGGDAGDAEGGGDAGGCSCRTTTGAPSRSSPIAAFAVLALAALARRRRHGQQTVF
jgi:MYXO-CTERM domain-containing protein